MILTRYRDVAGALRDPRYGVVGGTPDETSHRAMREMARELYSPVRVAGWQPEFAEAARQIAETLRGDIELVRDLAEPYSLRVARVVTGIEFDRARELVPLAQAIFESGASPGEPALEQQSRDATRQLARQFPDPSSSPLDVQAFVALAVSLPAFIGNACLALLEHRDQLQWIGEARAIDELLRFAGPSVRQLRVHDGQSVELRLKEANRDPDQFPEPDRLDLRRDSSGHLAFGAGAHACVGGALIRASCAVLFPVAAERFHNCELQSWEAYGGPSIRGHRVYVRL